VPTDRRLAACLAAAALAGAGCGDDAAPQPRAKSPSPPVSATAAYVKTVAEIHRPIDSARFRYTHGSDRPAQQRLALVDVQVALDDAAHAMKTLRPPAAAARLHRKLTRIWHDGAEHFDRLLSRRRFDSAAASALAHRYLWDRMESLYSDIFTLPQ